jgi:hypothetical protein
MIVRLVLSGLFLAATLHGNPAMAVEEPPFTVVLQDGAFELRDYPSLIVAEVTVSGGQKEAANRGFRLLAGYIFGGNSRRQSIAMTAPVAQEPAGERIAMTAPVSQTRDADTWRVRFTMPGRYSLADLPAPNDPRVSLKAAPAGRFAVLRFSGLAEPNAVDGKIAALGVWVSAHHLRAVGPASLAQYNPPWTLWFMRRNEVMIPVNIAK